MWGTIISAGLPLLADALSGGSKKKNQPIKTGTSTMETPDRMSYDEALGQAEDILQPQYQESKEKTLGQLDNNMINSGFYGQAPGDAIKSDTITDMEADYQRQLSSFATNLQDRDYKQQYQNYQLQQQNRAYQNQQQQQTFGNIGTGAAIGQNIGEEFGESGWGAGLGALAGWLFS